MTADQRLVALILDAMDAYKGKGSPFQHLAEALAPSVLMREDLEQVGTWLLPEAYGPDYDHFTETKMPTKPGHHVAVYRLSSHKEPHQ